MIIPNFSKGFSWSQFKNHWYCFYNEIEENDNFTRYLHPDGWKLTANYWENRAEMEKCFQKFNQCPREIEDFERRQLAMEKQFFEEMMQKDLEDYLDQ